MARPKFTYIPVQSIQPDPQQPRSGLATPTREMTQALESLAKSIAELGVLEPILVRPSQTRSDAYVVISGERRWRAARMAGLQEIPCLVEKGEEADGLRVAKQLAENIQREALPALDIAKSVKACLTNYAITQRKLAERLGYTESWVSRTLALLETTGAVRKALEHNLIEGYNNVEAFKRLPIPAQNILLRKVEKQVKESGEGKITKGLISEASRFSTSLEPTPARPSIANESIPTLKQLLEEDDTEDAFTVANKKKFKSQDLTYALTVRLTPAQLQRAVKKMGGQVETTDPFELVSVLAGLLTKP